MKLLYIHQYFTTPNQSGGTRSYWISKELLKRGHRVTMLTSDIRGKGEKDIVRKNIDGIEAIYLKVPYSQKMSVIQRLLSFVRFMFRSTWIALKEKDLDLIIATSTPLTVGFPALVVNKLKKTPYLFEVRDLWPEVPIQMGALNNKLAQKVAIWFEKTIYKNAVHVVALSPGMFDGVIKHGVQPQKVSMIPNMSKIDIFYPRIKNEALRQKLNLKEDSFKVVYFGAMGVANGMEYIIDGISHLNNRPDIEFVFMGWGATEKALKEKSDALGLKNTHFLGGFPLHELSEIVNLCDVSLVTFANIPILYTNSPNKLFDSLSAGKPIIVNSPGWTKAMVEDNNCGLFVNPENPMDLAEKIIFLRENPEIARAMGENSRKLAETTYDKSILCEQFADIVDSLPV